jgi:hypothetical protein
VVGRAVTGIETASATEMPAEMTAVRAAGATGTGMPT